ncbi:MAG: hypothetical protein LBB34_03180 [Holosporales bacterium]|jgi:hypothetical protein|nr:hypothetical protein [Holosporales bacterium]
MKFVKNVRLSLLLGPAVMTIATTGINAETYQTYDETLQALSDFAVATTVVENGVALKIDSAISRDVILRQGAILDLRGQTVLGAGYEMMMSGQVRIAISDDDGTTLVSTDTSGAMIYPATSGIYDQGEPVVRNAQNEILLKDTQIPIQPAIIKNNGHITLITPEVQMLRNMSSIIDVINNLESGQSNLTQLTVTGVVEDSSHQIATYYAYHMVNPNSGEFVPGMTIWSTITQLATVIQDDNEEVPLVVVDNTYGVIPGMLFTSFFPNLLSYPLRPIYVNPIPTISITGVKINISNAGGCMEIDDENLVDGLAVGDTVIPQIRCKKIGTSNGGGIKIDDEILANFPNIRRGEKDLQQILGTTYSTETQLKTDLELIGLDVETELGTTGTSGGGGIYDLLTTPGKSGYAMLLGNTDASSIIDVENDGEIEYALHNTGNNTDIEFKGEKTCNVTLSGDNSQLSSATFDVMPVFKHKSAIPRSTTCLHGAKLERSATIYAGNELRVHEGLHLSNGVLLVVYGNLRLY